MAAQEKAARKEGKEKKPAELNPITIRAMKKFVLDYRSLSKITEGLRTAGNRIILTIGTWDVLHVGHVR